MEEVNTQNSSPAKSTSTPDNSATPKPHDLYKELDTAFGMAKKSVTESFTWLMENMADAGLDIKSQLWGMVKFNNLAIHLMLSWVKDLEGPPENIKKEILAQCVSGLNESIEKYGYVIKEKNTPSIILPRGRA